jgi:hypothetical protein
VDLEDLRLAIYDGFHRDGRAPGEAELIAVDERSRKPSSRSPAGVSGKPP